MSPRTPVSLRSRLFIDWGGSNKTKDDVFQRFVGKWWLFHGSCQICLVFGQVLSDSPPAADTDQWISSCFSFPASPALEDFNGGRCCCCWGGTADSLWLSHLNNGTTGRRENGNWVEHNRHVKIGPDWIGLKLILSNADLLWWCESSPRRDASVLIPPRPPPPRTN